MARDIIQSKLFVDTFWVLLGVYVFYGAYLLFSQERITYQPTPQDFAACSEFVQSEKVTYEGTRMYFKDNGPRIVVLYHGNFGSACDRAFYAELFEEAGYSYLVPEYAGYSNDAVKPSHERIKKDVEHTIRFLEGKNFSDIVVVGESVGVRFAAYHASLSSPQKILLISSFVSLVDIAQNAFWYYPVELLMKDPFDNARLIEGFSGSIVLLHGEKDTIIPLSLGEKLFERLAAPHKEFIVVPEAGHNDLFAFSESSQVIRDFLK